MKTQSQNCVSMAESYHSLAYKIYIYKDCFHYLFSAVEFINSLYSFYLLFSQKQKDLIQVQHFIVVHTQHYNSEALLFGVLFISFYFLMFFQKAKLPIGVQGWWIMKEPMFTKNGKNLCLSGVYVVFAGCKGGEEVHVLLYIIYSRVQTVCEFCSQLVKVENCCSFMLQSHLFFQIKYLFVKVFLTMWI